MNIFQIDCCHPWIKNPFKNSCSRQLRIVNAVVTLIASRSTKSVFLQTKATHFETMMTTVDEVNNDKQKYRMNVLFVVFCLLVLRPNSMGKLINNRCKLTCKRLIKLYGCIRVCKRTMGFLFLCVSPLLSVVHL